MLHRVADRLGIEIATFGDMSVEEVAVDCGMPLLQARLAKFREYTEPFRLLRDNADVNKLLKVLRSAGLSCSRHGHYYHAGAVRRDVGAQLLRGLRAGMRPHDDRRVWRPCRRCPFAAVGGCASDCRRPFT